MVISCIITESIRYVLKNIFLVNNFTNDKMTLTYRIKRGKRTTRRLLSSMTVNVFSCFHSSSQFLISHRFAACHGVHSRSFPRSVQPPEHAWVSRQVWEPAVQDEEWAAVVEVSEELLVERFDRLVE